MNLMERFFYRGVLLFFLKRFRWYSVSIFSLKGRGCLIRLGVVGDEVDYWGGGF